MIVQELLDAPIGTVRTVPNMHPNDLGILLAAGYERLEVKPTELTLMRMSPPLIPVSQWPGQA
ncbi:hypothetical protein [Methylobacterium sp. D48H]